MKKHWAVNGLTFILGLMLNAALLLIAAYLIYTYAIKGYEWGEDFAGKLTEERPDKEVEFVLEEDTSREDAAVMLEELGLIENRYYFQLELFLKNSSTEYKAGTYTLNYNMDTDDINVALRKQPEEEVEQKTITIPEGFNTRDIAAYLEEEGYMRAEEFIEACNTHSFNYTFLNGLPEREMKLEGYLFPDTYYLTENPTADEIIEKMLARFDQIFTSEYEDRANELGYSIDQVITMAAIIEEEVRVPEERKVVAQVIYNRLDDGMNLQMCSTVLYALNKKLDRLLFEDLEVESPYNTYNNSGLPLGPITNPGAECINAVLYPDEGSGYLFFVLKDEETGEHIFTDTFEDHINAQEEYGQFY